MPHPEVQTCGQCRHWCTNGMILDWVEGMFGACNATLPFWAEDGPEIEWIASEIRSTDTGAQGCAFAEPRAQGAPVPPIPVRLDWALPCQDLP